MSDLNCTRLLSKSLLVIFAVLLQALISQISFAEAPTSMEDFHKLMSQRWSDKIKTYDASPFSALTKDFFSRFVHDPNAKPDANEIVIDKTWKIILPSDGTPLGELMSSHFAEFMTKQMDVNLPTEKQPLEDLSKQTDKAFVFLDSGGGDTNTPESFTITVTKDEVRLIGKDQAGLRDGIVKLMDMIGFRQAPILKINEQVYKPRLKVRIGDLGSLRDTVLMGYNAILIGGGDLYAISTSDAIPELAARRQAGVINSIINRSKEARLYGLKTYVSLSTVHKFPKDDPIFATHPDIRGTLTWAADGEYTICTEHPLVKQYLAESVEGFFRDVPELDGVTIIIGGEGFYHCFMRPYGQQKGHTNCPRCEALGPDKVVANLCNYLAEAARKVNPNAEVVAWPYSAEAVWSSDRPQSGFIKNLKPGVAIITEVDKDDILKKPGGIQKALWDYSIDLIGPGERAKQQIKLCNEKNIPIYVISMPEQTFDYALLPHIPCMDRWADRAEALASCGATGAYVWQMGPYDAASSAEINKFFWWDPAPAKEELLEQFATRIAGKEAGPYVREAWKKVSLALPYSLKIGSYYKGPSYLGPAHPMFADVNVVVPEVFEGYYLFLGEMTAGHAMKPLPTYCKTFTEASGESGADKNKVFIESYRTMETLLKRAADDMTKVRPLVPHRCNLMFNAEYYPVQWYYHTARTEANFYESCYLRDQLTTIAAQASKTPKDIKNAQKLYNRWKEVLLDEKENTTEAMPITKADVRLDFYHRGDHSFPHLTDMIEAKLLLLDHDLNEFLPALAKRCNIEEK